MLGNIGKFSLVSVMVMTISLTSVLPVFAEETTLTINLPNDNKNIEVDKEISIPTTATGITGTITYNIVDTHPRGTMYSSNVDANGVIKWKPTYDELGLHTVTITASGSGSFSAVGTAQIIVNLPTTSLTVGPLKPGDTVGVGGSVEFLLTATGFASPSFSLADNFPGSTISSINISSSGNFNWTPTNTDVGNHSITITARDYRDSVNKTAVSITVKPAGTFIPSTIVATPLAPIVSSSPIVSMPASTSATTFTSFLNLGSKGLEVSALQKVLLAEGYYTGDITGYLGVLTQSALKKYQSAHGVDPLGYVGPGTRTVLNNSAVAGANVQASVSVVNPIAPSATATMSATDRASRIQALRVVIQYLQAELTRLEYGQ